LRSSLQAGQTQKKRNGIGHVPYLAHTLAPFPLMSVAIILFVGYLRRDRLRASRT
jgi:hypothetical protein